MRSSVSAEYERPKPLGSSPQQSLIRRELLEDSGSARSRQDQSKIAALHLRVYELFEHLPRAIYALGLHMKRVNNERQNSPHILSSDCFRQRLDLVCFAGN